MGKDSKIEWCQHTANLWWGCHEVHAGCDNCYARTLARSKGKAKAWEGARFAVGSIWGNLEKWQAEAAKANRIDRVFTGSMMDIFEKSMPVLTWNGSITSSTTGDLRHVYLNDVVPSTPNLMHLLLTKRPGNIKGMVPIHWRQDWPKNVMKGTSVVNQATADTLIPQLLSIDGPTFLSMEPLLGFVDITPWIDRIDWVIVGGESGPNSRPMHPAWSKSILRQCQDAGVPYLFKQWGEYSPEPLKNIRFTPVNSGVPMDYPASMFRVGKTLAGRELDGRTWDELPKVLSTE